MNPRPARAEITAEFEQLAPWVFQFRIDGADYGGRVSALGDLRIDHFRACAPEAKTILELGSLEGAHTFLLAEHAQRVLAIEGRAANLRKARLVQRLLRADNVEFVQANLEETDLTSFGKFDAVLCCGLLYHLPEPWKLLEQLPRVAPKVLIWTQYADDLAADTVRHGLRGIVRVEGGADEPLSGMSHSAFWLTLGSLIKVLTTSGYERVHVLHHDLEHANGPAVVISAATAAAPPAQAAPARSSLARLFRRS
ncbi:hypothetical protein BH20VER2_BH20VER2_07150 [soil metagenome]